MKIVCVFPHPHKGVRGQHPVYNGVHGVGVAQHVDVHLGKAQVAGQQWHQIVVQVKLTVRQGAEMHLCVRKQ